MLGMPFWASLRFTGIGRENTIVIIDKIRNIDSYYSLVPDLKKAVEFALSLSDQPEGRYECEELPQGAVYAMVQTGKTQPYSEGRIEAHRKYLDVQILLEGGETVYYEDVEGLKEAEPYSEEKDIVFYECGGQPARIEKGMFYLVLPQDGHMPCRELDGPGTYRKIVLKVRL